MTCSDEEIGLKLVVEVGDIETFWGIFNKNDFYSEASPIEYSYTDGHDVTYYFCLPWCADYIFLFVSKEQDTSSYTLFVDDEEIASGTAVKEIRDDLYFSTAEIQGVDCETSCASDEITFELDLATDFYGDETSWELTNVLSGSVVTYGPETNDSYYGNYYYYIRECLPCGEYDFTIYDSYGDGLSAGGVMNMGGWYDVTFDGEVLQSNVNGSFTSETTLSEGSHFNCATECKDSPLNLMVNKISRNCDWVKKGQTTKRCKNKGVKTHCPVTCESLEHCTSDSTKRIQLGNDAWKSCKWVSNAKTESRCNKTGMRDTCRATCAV